MNEVICVTLVDADDWEGLFIDGKLVFEDHEITARYALKQLSKIGKPFKFDYVDAAEETVEDIFESGHFPEKLSEVVIRK